MRLSILCPLVLLLLGSAAAHADTYQYQVVYNADEAQASVIFDLPDIPTDFTYVSSSGFISSSTSAVYYDPDDYIESIDFVPLAADDCTGVQESCFVFLTHYDYSLPLFFNGDLTAPGVYTDPGRGSLTITDITPPPVPEPGSVALLGTGLLALFSLYRCGGLSAAEPPL